MKRLKVGDRGRGAGWVRVVRERRAVVMAVVAPAGGEPGPPVSRPRW